MIVTINGRSIEVPNSVPETEREAWAMNRLRQINKGETWRGLGDVVAAATSAIGIKPCGKCQKRREALNRLVPFSNENPPPAGQLPAATDGGEKND
jgi:hypothetical protein